MVRNPKQVQGGDLTGKMQEMTPETLEGHVRLPQVVPFLGSARLMVATLVLALGVGANAYWALATVRTLQASVALHRAVLACVLSQPPSAPLAACQAILMAGEGDRRTLERP